MPFDKQKSVLTFVEEASKKNEAAPKSEALKSEALKSEALKSEEKQTSTSVIKIDQEKVDSFKGRPRNVYPNDDSAECKHIRSNFLGSDEHILLYTRNLGEYNIVLLTETRILKVEKSKVVSSAVLSNMAEAYQEKNGVFHWDKIVVRLKNGGIETFGVSSKDAATYFVNILEKIRAQ